MRILIPLKQILVSCLILTMVLSACSRKNEVAPEAGAESSGWTTSILKSGDGYVVRRSKINSDELELMRNEYRRVNLIQLPVDGKFNANVLQFTDASVSAYQNTAFIAPKLFSYGTVEGGALAPYLHSDGNVTLAFNVIFLDGTTETLLNPRTDMLTVRVPDLFKVKDEDALKKVLSKQFGITKVAPLFGCPKKLSLEAAGESYDVTPRAFLRGDFCQLNVPVSVNLTVPPEQAKMILEIGLPSHTVDLIGTYETKVSYPISKISVKFDRSKIFSELKAELGVKAYFVDADVKIASTKIAIKQALRITVQGTPPDFASQIAQKIASEFFEPFVANPNSPDFAACSSETAGCVRFGLTLMNQSEAMEMEWAEESNLMSGQNYMTITKLKATPRTVKIGSVDGCSSTEFGGCDRLTNDAVPRDTTLSVQAGSLVTIDPELIVRERRDNASPVTQRVDNVLCPKMDYECSGIMANVKCTCKHPENHWGDYTDFSSGIHSPDLIYSPAGKIGELYDGLSLQFRSIDQRTHENKIVECPVNAFERDSWGNSITLKTENVPGCTPFADTKTPASLYLVNHIYSPQAYLIGRRIVLWNGQVTEQPRTDHFLPKVDFAGMVTVSGYTLRSDGWAGNVLGSAIRRQ